MYVAVVLVATTLIISSEQKPNKLHGDPKSLETRIDDKFNPIGTYDIGIVLPYEISAREKFTNIFRKPVSHDKISLNRRGRKRPRKTVINKRPAKIQNKPNKPRPRPKNPPKKPIYTPSKSSKNPKNRNTFRIVIGNNVINLGNGKNLVIEAGQSSDEEGDDQQDYENSDEEDEYDQRECRGNKCKPPKKKLKKWPYKQPSGWPFGNNYPWK
ncbi:unnamed protein product [Leptosia nina]|uniref:Uncharacterized protein n=1 Tax=Leptosia nina TaxID=320188 RepID=A0AAV1JHY7_9NEOP